MHSANADDPLPPYSACADNCNGGHPGHGQGFVQPPPQPRTKEEAARLDLYEEQMAFLRVEAAFIRYRTYALRILEAKKTHWQSVKPQHKALLPDYSSHHGGMEKCIIANADFMDHTVAQSSHAMFAAYWPDGHVVNQVDQPTALDMDKVLSTFRQFVRDWSDEGKAERDVTYGPLLEQLGKSFPNVNARGNMKVLVPGSGLSRLAFEIYMMGFQSQGSEFSHHMLIQGSFILNHVAKARSFTIYPFVHHITNNRERGDPLRPIHIPDVAPCEALENAPPNNGGFSMCAGDFLEVYSKPSEVNAWNAVVTCFFIDTAHNIFEYISTLSRLLVVGGVWLNVGPLLWHFADQMNEVSIELAWSDVKKIIVDYGFDILEERNIKCTYTTNTLGLMAQTYTAIFMHAVKTNRPLPPI
eukprot:NODE_659_length_1456_cov_107.656716_g494_i0.p1 GENE.NODE_659_length_1456_cov_107.656716_g494_i0~~NODE_659_length_1456_cov_107.656716_g494_i0.p1  ORF type:complete len:434 (-),score=111.80 NODE_659_length_1456_cov_107.656716_g494_i0:155-1393(-)